MVAANLNGYNPDVNAVVTNGIAPPSFTLP